MDKLTEYRNLIKRLIQHYARLYQLEPVPGEEELLVIDEERDHYMLLTLGWDGDKRVHRTPLYVRLHNGKFWVEEDWTEEGIATDLLRAGVPREDIVLAFHPPSMRSYTEFAVA
jgi:hypothetical protein